MRFRLARGAPCLAYAVRRYGDQTAVTRQVRLCGDKEFTFTHATCNGGSGGLPLKKSRTRTAPAPSVC